MALTPTRGSAVVTRTSAAPGGPRLNVLASDIAIATSIGLGLQFWLDGDSRQSAGASIALVDRVSGRKATAENGVALALGSTGQDDLIFRWPAAADNSRIVIPDVALSASYWAMTIVKPTDGPTTTRALLYSSGAGTLAESWLQQSAAGEALDYRVRNNGAGGINRSKAVPHSVRSLLWWGYDAVRDRYAVGLNRTLLQATTGQGQAHVPVAGLFFGGRGGTGLPTQHQVGDVDMLMIGSGPIYSASTEADVNGMRDDLITLVSDRYGLGLPSA